MVGEHKDLLTVKDACEILQISRTTLVNYLKNGELKGVKLGKKRVWRRDLEEFVNSEVWYYI